MKISKQERNRILGLHLAESHNKKISSVLSEQINLPFLTTPAGPWDKDDCGNKCEQRPTKVPPGSMVTAVMSNYFDGQKCKSLSYGGGPFYSMEKCKQCCEGKTLDKNAYPCFEALMLIFPKMEPGDEQIAKDAWDQSFESNVTEGPWAYEEFYEEMCDVDGENVCDICEDIIGEKPIHLPVSDIPGGVDNDCLYDVENPTRKFGYCKFGNKLPIGNVTIGDYITIEDCCKLGGKEIENPNGNIDVDEKKKGPKKCTWRPEPVEDPTLDERGKSINNIRVCHEGENVKLIQSILLGEGYDLGKSGPDGDGVDGKFGGKTKKAVKEYQRKYGLGVDGIVGNETWSHMFPEEEEIIITPDIENEISNEEPMTDDELETFIEDNLEDKTNRKQCRDIMKGLSQKIKNNPYSTEVIDMIDNEDLKLTLGYCLDERNYPGIMGHVRRIKKAFGLKGKGNN